MCFDFLIPLSSGYIFQYVDGPFETIEKLFLIADIAFSEDFKIKGYLKSFEDFMDPSIDQRENYSDNNDIINNNAFTLETLLLIRS